MLYLLTVPMQPRNLHAVPVSPNEISTKWQIPIGDSKIISYIVYFNDSHRRQNAQVTINPPTPRYNIIDLTPNTVYHIQVSAVSAQGEGAKTPTIQVRTPQFGMFLSMFYVIYIWILW